MQGDCPDVKLPEVHMQEFKAGDYAFTANGTWTAHARLFTECLHGRLVMQLYRSHKSTTDRFLVPSNRMSDSPERLAETAADYLMHWAFTKST